MAGSPRRIIWQPSLARGSTTNSKSRVLRRDISSKTQAQSGVTAPVETYLRYKRATVIPFSLKFCEATCVFAHQKMRGVFARAFLVMTFLPGPWRAGPPLVFQLLWAGPGRLAKKAQPKKSPARKVQTKNSPYKKLQENNLGLFICFTSFKEFNLSIYFCTSLWY